MKYKSGAEKTTRVLFIDSDLSDRFQATPESIRAVAKIIGVRVKSIRVERSQGGGTHWIVTVTRDLTPLEAVAIQACMGDDLMRCALNLGRVLSGKADGMPWNILFNRKTVLQNRSVVNAETEKKGRRGKGSSD